MPDRQSAGRLTADVWRRVCSVLDRLDHAQPESREGILEDACREHGLSIEEVRRFVDAQERSHSLPEEFPVELIENAFGDIAPEAADVRLNAGQKLGPFEIVAFLGAGGMGEVYRAVDSRLERTVAIKVVRPHLLQSEDARRRFDQEARAISKLTHPHVCTLYDVGHQGGVDFLVMEHVEGETLAERLQRGAIPIAQATRLGSQIADALDRAHRQGIVHRDLKPANIMLTRSGVKLLDFGLARLDVAGGSDDRALMGTPQYMSPEQLERRQADSRSDIFACGAVLYEMVTGQRAFAGSSQASVIAAIVERDPVPVAQRVPAVPAALDWTIARCLAKDPEDRWQSAADLKHHLEWLTVSPETPRPSSRSSRLVFAVTAATVLAAVFFAVWAWGQRATDSPPGALSTFPIYPPPGTTFDGTHAISPDGRRIAFAAVPSDGPPQLWVRSLDSLAPQRIVGSEGAAHPFWSPNGQLVGFFADRKLKKVDLTSGNVHVICDVAGGGGGGSWNRDDMIIFSSAGPVTGLWRVSASGGQAAAITPTEANRRDAWPQFLPDGRRFIYMSAGSHSERGIYLGRLDSADTHPVITKFSQIPPSKGILADDVLFFLNQSTLMAQRFDAVQMTPLSEPVRVAENVRWGPPGVAPFHASSGGVIAYRQPASARSAQLTWLDHDGRTIGHVGDAGPSVTVEISPDGRSALVNQWEERGRPSSGSVRRIDLATGAPTTLFKNAASPIWSHDASQIVFTRFGLGLDAGPPTPMVAALDGRAPARRLAEFETQGHATDWSGDGQFIVGSTQHADTMWDIWITEADGGGPVRYLVREPFNDREAKIAPDGRTVAYAASDAGGNWDVYVRSFPDGGAVRRVSTRGGRSPRWHPHRRELYYVEPRGRVMRVRIAAGSDGAPSAPELIFEHPGLVDTLEGAGFAYDVAADGRFLVGMPTSTDIPSTPIVVILNWRFPAGR